MQKLAEPYYATAAAWYETIRIGLTAGELYDVTFSRIGDPFYGVYLNPGHFIHLDEWPSSPVSSASPVVFASGNALQLDIIPITGSAYHTAQIEDGVVLADAELRAADRGELPRRVEQDPATALDGHEDLRNRAARRGAAALERSRVLPAVLARAAAGDGPALTSPCLRCFDLFDALSRHLPTAGRRSAIRR